VIEKNFALFQKTSADPKLKEVLAQHLFIKISFFGFPCLHDKDKE
jgi:hypothetical protein